MTPAAPSGVVTFLFTDVEGSTRRWEADAADNPHVVSLALFAYGIVRRDSDPLAAYGVLRRGLGIAQDSGNRQSESNLAVSLSGLAAAHGDPMDAFD